MLDSDIRTPEQVLIPGANNQRRFVLKVSESCGLRFQLGSNYRDVKPQEVHC